MKQEKEDPARALHQAEARYHSLYHTIPAFVHSIDADGRLVSVSDCWLELMGYERHEVIGRRSSEFLTDLSRRYAVETVLPAFMLTGICQDVPYQFVKKTGEILDILLSATAERDATGQIERTYAVLVNVTPQKEAEARWRESERRLQDFLATATDWLWEIDADLRFSYISTGHGETAGDVGDVLGKTRWELHDMTPECDEKWRAHLADLEACRPFRDFEYQFVDSNGNIQYRLISGAPIIDNHDVFHGYRGTGRDISARKKADLAIKRMALHDTLTGLPNRLSFNQELEQACAAASCGGDPIVVMLLDLDHFKDINDTLGHAAGDKLLVEIAQRLKKCIRSCDLVARLGGDEFAMIMSRPYERQIFDDLATRIIEAVGEPVSLGGHAVRTGISLGVAVYPDDGIVGETMLAHADLALYAAKKAGRKTWRGFEKSMEQRLNAQRTLDEELRHALEQQQFELYYQPIVDIANDDIVGMEALLRWNHPKSGLIVPDVFIPAMERNWLIIPMTEWALCEALAQQQSWANENVGEFRVAVNIAPQSLKADGFADLIKRHLADAQFDPRHLVIEITEGSLIDKMAVVPVLKALRAFGVSIAVDDFGADYSSMARLKALPIDILKIDRSFLSNNNNDIAIVEALVKVGRSLGKKVIVEGVERPKQWLHLGHVGCHQAQGFLIAPPMPATDLPAWIRRWQRRRHDQRQRPTASEMLTLEAPNSLAPLASR